MVSEEGVMFSAMIKSTCPVCDRNIDGTLTEENGKILLRKSCADHGETVDLISGDAELFKQKYDLIDQSGEKQACKCSVKRCLGGICSSHAEQKTSIAFLDITSRCNMNCPVCFADAEHSGADFSLEGIRKIIAHLRDKEAISRLTIIGGEPTLHRDLIPILKEVSAAGLRDRTLISTNGLKLADIDFCRQLASMGFRTYAVGFDGTTEEIYKATRGTTAGFHAARKVIENLRQLRRGEVILNVTVMKGVNDHDLPNAVRFGLENSDVVRRFLITLGTFCGRDSRPADLLAQRITMEDVEHRLREATGSKNTSISASLILFFAKPFELLHLDRILGNRSSVSRHEHPLCDNFAYIGLTREGKMVSIFDLLLRRVENIYRDAKRFQLLSERIEKSRARFLGRLGDNVVARVLWSAFAIPWYGSRAVAAGLGLIRP
jgi:7,8-dihydro-6-hydroxymethylpterin dimethyltransferase